jgi:hypothetical protein
MEDPWFHSPCLRHRLSREVLDREAFDIKEKVSMSNLTPKDYVGCHCLNGVRIIE